MSKDVLYLNLPVSAKEGIEKAGRFVRDKDGKRSNMTKVVAALGESCNADIDALEKKYGANMPPLNLLVRLVPVKSRKAKAEPVNA